MILITLMKQDFNIISSNFIVFNILILKIYVHFSFRLLV